MELVIKITDGQKKFIDKLVASGECYEMLHPVVIDEVMEEIKNGTPLSEVHERKLEEIVVQYPTAELCTYPEYRGKPYFSIKYEENGEHIIGFGTYKPEVLSRYLREYFIAPTII